MPSRMRPISEKLRQAKTSLISRHLVQAIMLRLSKDIATTNMLTIRILEVETMHVYMSQVVPMMSIFTLEAAGIPIWWLDSLRVAL